MPRIFKLFRGLGLRHLVVVNRKNEVICMFQLQFYSLILNIFVCLQHIRNMLCDINGCVLFQNLTAVI